MDGMVLVLSHGLAMFVGGAVVFGVMTFLEMQSANRDSYADELRGYMD